MDTFLAAAAALAAPLGVGFLFALAIRALMNADRTERLAMARLEAQERARAGRTADGRATGDRGPARSSTTTTTTPGAGQDDARP